MVMGHPWCWTVGVLYWVWSLEWVLVHQEKWNFLFWVFFYNVLVFSLILSFNFPFYYLFCISQFIIFFWSIFQVFDFSQNFHLSSFFISFFSFSFVSFQLYRSFYHCIFLYMFFSIFLVFQFLKFSFYQILPLFCFLFISFYFFHLFYYFILIFLFWLFSFIFFSIYKGKAKIIFGPQCLFKILWVSKFFFLFLFSL